MEREERNSIASVYPPGPASICRQRPIVWIVVDDKFIWGPGRWVENNQISFFLFHTALSGRAQTELWISRLQRTNSCNSSRAKLLPIIANGTGPTWSGLLPHYRRAHPIPVYSCISLVFVSFATGRRVRENTSLVTGVFAVGAMKGARKIRPTRLDFAFKLAVGISLFIK